MESGSFKAQIYELVSQIPRGKVMTYGQIAYLCGRPRAARIVGGLAEGYPGGTEGHRQVLEGEGVDIDTNYRVDMEKHLWRP